MRLNHRHAPVEHRLRPIARGLRAASFGPELDFHIARVGQRFAVGQRCRCNDFVGRCLGFRGFIAFFQLHMLAIARTALDRAATAPTSHLGQDGFGALAGHDRVGDPIRVLFVRVAGRTNTAGKLNTGALLHDVSGLVRRRVQVGRAAEGNVIVQDERWQFGPSPELWATADLKEVGTPDRFSPAQRPAPRG